MNKLQLPIGKRMELNVQTLVYWEGSKAYVLNCNIKVSKKTLWDFMYS